MTTQFRFGDFKLLPAERLLFRRGSEVALTARAFEVLVAFAERAGQLLSKDDLLKRVWAGLVVEENNLAVQVAALRKVLGAQAITTIAGPGYRFALDVIEVAGVGPDPSGPRGQGNLPVRLPSLIGRAAELAKAVALLRSHPMLTLCGGPGFGKTRLAQELARQLREQYADGAWWIDLTLLREDESVALAVARTLGLSLPPDTEPLAALMHRLAATATLIVLDNVEHCAEAASQVAEALARDTARNSVIVTSQVPLHAAGERLLRLAPLPLHEAVRLLAERAAGSDWDANDSEQAVVICRELDGNPLAIELAAARVDALGLAGLAARLNQRLTLLAPGDAVRPSRRNALAAALDWSHELLGARERAVLRRLAVFPGSFSLEGAALVLASDEFPATGAVEAVLSLIDRSLISAERGAQLRYRLLETTRLFALDKLDTAGETASAQARLCAGMRWLFDDAYEESWHTPPQQWRARYETELPCLWAALSWATQHDVDSAAALFGASSPLWNVFSLQAQQAKVHALTLAERVTDVVPAPTRARFWLACAHGHSAEYPGQARAAAERAARLYRELGDARGEYLA
ncbi:MAG TPA: winged helix-turn-helix domain-containing protein, partial [Burkholderiaceae bacterium]